MIVEKAIWKLESCLSAAITLNELASAVATSPYHLSRVFGQVTGRTPMHYLRSRRLSVAALRIVATQDPFTAIAFDLQYGSPEAFSRAFKAEFGLSPRSLRKVASVSDVNITERFTMTPETQTLVPPHRIETRPSFEVAGLATEFTPADPSPIARCWVAFNPRATELSRAMKGAAYGVCAGETSGGILRYLSGLEVEPGSEIPSDMQRVSIPRARYAVFTHSGHISTIGQTVQAAWDRALPEAGLIARKSPDFERYDHRFDPHSGRGDVEIWIPVE